MENTPTPNHDSRIVYGENGEIPVIKTPEEDKTYKWHHYQTTEINDEGKAISKIHTIAQELDIDGNIVEPNVVLKADGVNYEYRYDPKTKFTNLVYIGHIDKNDVKKSKLLPKQILERLPPSWVESQPNLEPDKPESVQTQTHHTIINRLLIHEIVESLTGVDTDDQRSDARQYSELLTAFINKPESIEYVLGGQVDQKTLNNFRSLVSKIRAEQNKVRNAVYSDERTKHIGRTILSGKSLYSTERTEYDGSPMRSRRGESGFSDKDDVVASETISAGRKGPRTRSEHRYSRRLGRRGLRAKRHVMNTIKIMDSTASTHRTVPDPSTLKSLLDQGGISKAQYKEMKRQSLEVSKLRRETERLQHGTTIPENTPGTFPDSTPFLGGRRIPGLGGRRIPGLGGRRLTQGDGHTKTRRELKTENQLNHSLQDRDKAILIFADAVYSSDSIDIKEAVEIIKKMKKRQN